MVHDYHDFWDEVQLFVGVTDIHVGIDLKATGVQLGYYPFKSRLKNSADHADAFGIGSVIT